MCIICNDNIPDSNKIIINNCEQLTYDIFMKYNYINKINNRENWISLYYLFYFYI